MGCNKRTSFALALAFSIFGVGALFSEPKAGDPQEIGRSLTSQFYQGKMEKVWDAFSPEMKKALVSLDQLKAFRQQVADQLGEEKEVVSEGVAPTGKMSTYTRLARFAKHDGVIQVVWTFDEAGVVQGFYVRPQQKAAESKYLDYQTKTPLRLPFDGQWYVFWGGRAIEQNYHVVAKDQRFAYDIVIMRDGSSHTGEGTSNDDYHCFGKPILAPAEGTVVEAVDGIEDNKPGEMNPKQPVGNHVVIDHGNGEFSFLAHLKRGTVKVKKGDELKAGDAIGLCGNSGNSSEPHLHYHLQTTPTFHEGEGLPAPFNNYLADGKPVDRGEPTKGQTIEPQKP